MDSRTRRVMPQPTGQRFSSMRMSISSFGHGTGTEVYFAYVEVKQALFPVCCPREAEEELSRLWRVRDVCSWLGDVSSDDGYERGASKGGVLPEREVRLREGIEMVEDEGEVVNGVRHFCEA